MKLSQIWALQKASIICLNTYLIFSLNFVAIFAHGSPDRIHDNIHSSRNQKYRQHHQQSDTSYSNSVSFDLILIIPKDIEINCRSYKKQNLTAAVEHNLCENMPNIIFSRLILFCLKGGNAINVKY